MRLSVDKKEIKVLGSWYTKKEIESAVQLFNSAKVILIKEQS